MFQLVLGGAWLSFLAWNIFFTAQGVVAFDLTGNSKAVGAVSFAQGVSTILLNPIVGTLVDRVSRRLLMAVAQLAIGVTLFGVAILLSLDAISVFALAVSAFALGTFYAVNTPTRVALLSEVMPSDKLGKAMALYQAGTNVPTVVGPFISGLVLGIAFLGATGAYYIAAAIMIVATVLALRIKSTHEVQRSSSRSFSTDLRIGFGYVRSRPRIMRSIVGYHLMSLFGLNFVVLFPAYALDLLDVGSGGLGALYGFQAVGGFVAGLGSAALANSKQINKYVLLSCLMLALGTFGIGVAGSLPVALVLVAIVGAAATVFRTLLSILVTNESDPAMIGRTMSLLYMAWGMQSLFALPVGILADSIGVRTVLIILGVNVLVVACLLAAWQKFTAGEPGALTKMDRFQSSERT